MAGSNQKLPLGKSLNDVATRKALDFIHMTGKALPCSIVKVVGSIATIKFEVGGGYQLPNIKIPIMEPRYSRGAHQVGDKGYAVPGAVQHGNMSGLGPSTAPGLAEPANLAALAFHPLGNSNWPAASDPGKRIHEGPSGTTSQTMDGNHSVTTDTANGVTHKSSAKVTTDAPNHNVTGAQTIAGLLTANGGLSSSGGGGGGGFSAPAGGGPVSASGGIGIAPPLLLAYGYHAPSSGNTVTIPATEIVSLIDPSGLLSSLTIVLPTASDEQVQLVSFTQGVTTLTWTGSFAANAAPSTVASTGGQYRFIWSASQSKWFRI